MAMVELNSIQQLRDWISEDDNINPQRYKAILSENDTKFFLMGTVTTSRINNFVVKLYTKGDVDEFVKAFSKDWKGKIYRCERYRLQEDRDAKTE